MAIAKTEEFTQEAVYLADIAKALSHPARIQILKILTEMDVCMCGDIVELLPLAQSTVSQHLKELKRVGLIQGDIEGPKVCYCINSSSLKKAYEQIQKLFNQLTKGGSKSCETKKK
ncbi:MAG: winged helix-turn-helix transcriptional regulator [Ignavibacteriales bacterium]|nr:winged helix-turn-helix transcriptional regulator [Ignavibacteriales bacterium]